MLADVLRLHSMARLAERRIQNLDMGIAWTAHELRGPLLGVRAVLELMLQRELGSGPDRELLRRASVELDRLAGTAESLLSWAVGARPLELKRSDVVQIVEEAVQACRLETGVDRVVVSAPPHAIARVDTGMIQTAFVNLVRNALAHASPGTKVEVDVERDRERVLVRVRDHGPEIPIVERDSIFDPFVRGSTGGAGGNGNGLGLFIARRIVRAHDGDIWVGSDLGATTFLVTLPIVREQERRVAS
jgi:signal transduction histidine kinase